MANRKNEFELEEIILKDFDSSKLNQKPKNEKELYEYYAQYTDILVQYLRLKVSSLLRPLTNEVRALFGHLVEYQNRKQIDKRELEKAYGHFRRLTLDAFKILCDSYDAVLCKKMTKQYHYDFRSKKANYLKEFSNLYVSAKRAYINAQQYEKTGSDSTSNENIIQLYYDACVKYIKLKRFYCENKYTVFGVKIWAIVLTTITILSFVYSTIVSILDYIL